MPTFGFDAVATGFASAKITGAPTVASGQRYTANSGDVVTKIRVYTNTASRQFSLFLIRLDTLAISHLTTATSVDGPSFTDGKLEATVNWALESGVEYAVAAAASDGNSWSIGNADATFASDLTTRFSNPALDGIDVGDTFTIDSYTGAKTALVSADVSVAPSSTTINVDIPADIDLEWGTTHELAVTHDGGTTTLSNVTLSAPTGWETVTIASLPDTATTESFFEASQTDATVGNFTAQVGDTLAFTSAAGLTVDGSSIPVVNPAATVSGSYKWWSAGLQGWTPVSSYTITNLGVYSGGGGGGGDVTAPTLSSPTAYKTGFIGGFASVSTNEADGTLYVYTSTNSSETAATIKASGVQIAVTATGTQSTSLVGLTPETTYYTHFVHRDAAGNDSSVSSSASFITDAIPTPSGASSDRRLKVLKLAKRKAKPDVKQTIIKTIH